MVLLKPYVMKQDLFSAPTFRQLFRLTVSWYLSIQDLVMDILRVLTTPDLEVRKKTLQLALDLVSSRNVEEVGNVCCTWCFS